MPTYVSEIDPKNIPEDIATRFVTRGVLDIRGYQDYLKMVGFPDDVCRDKLHESPLHDYNKAKFKHFSFIYGPMYTGKTTLAANAIYWLTYQKLAAKGICCIDYVDAGEFGGLMVLADKIGIDRACQQTEINGLCGEDLWDLYDRITRELFKRDMVIFDDLNFDVLPEAAIIPLRRLIMKRFEHRAPTWIITNETMDSFGERFPRVAARIKNDDHWLSLKKGPINA